ncbi:MAG: hypothetical protein A2015_06380 [Spirochaetes bacterium GWF1_31_7]|nr:MAG: hypothetical protein A2Y30_08215 [Spirochaetes bacterium GWE1_32_154]OHD51416.1 MAG: hypothetical protein A2Y29_14600 [Spirochaetes bacterium GWE2_31_10]OHD53139.1 MAG: hypothetical protein A2015_06380 [Spirochaetes bacterium GWF1_31_7]
MEEMMNEIVGVWKLHTFHQLNEKGDVSYPFGQDAKGYIIYTESDHMSVNIMKAGRPPYQSNDIMNGTTEEKLAAMEGYTGYSGKYKIEGNKVIHLSEVSLIPNLIGLEQEREFTVDNDKLTLKTPVFLVDKQLQHAEIVFTKMQ